LFDIAKVTVIKIVLNLYILFNQVDQDKMKQVFKKISTFTTTVSGDGA
jgi:hypothetical protein